MKVSEFPPELTPVYGSFYSNFIFQCSVVLSVCLSFHFLGHGLVCPQTKRFLPAPFGIIEFDLKRVRNKTNINIYVSFIEFLPTATIIANYNSVKGSLSEIPTTIFSLSTIDLYILKIFRCTKILPYV